MIINIAVLVYSPRREYSAVVYIQSGSSIFFMLCISLYWCYFMLCIFRYWYFIYQTRSNFHLCCTVQNNKPHCVDSCGSLLWLLTLMVVDYDFCLCVDSCGSRLWLLFQHSPSIYQWQTLVQSSLHYLRIMWHRSHKNVLLLFDVQLNWSIMSGQLTAIVIIAIIISYFRAQALFSFKTWWLEWLCAIR